MWFLLHYSNKSLGMRWEEGFELVLFQGFHSMIFDSINSELEVKGNMIAGPRGWTVLLHG